MVDSCMLPHSMKFPALFVNHGGGPLPLLGRQPALAQHMKQVVREFLPPEPPQGIVVISAHWESQPVRITSSQQPSMLYDYHGFPAESYTFKYPAPGDAELAKRIQKLLDHDMIDSVLDDERGFDHGVFIPLMLMYPEANIPVVCVSLDGSLSARKNIAIGKSLAPLRDDGYLILGSGYTFHNLPAFFNPTKKTIQASKDFNEWLKNCLLSEKVDRRLLGLENWKNAPGAQTCHPREEHLLPLFVAAAAGGNSSVVELIYEEKGGDKNFQEHAISGYMFR